MHKKIISSAIALAFALPVFSAEQINLDEVVVSATRFSEPKTSAAPNIKIISNEEILSSPATNIPDLLKMQAGINVTSLYGSQGIDATVDMRGFGDATAVSNTLILLDGQRLNSVDSSNIQWASIPLQAIDHIEIIPGGGTVLYGDRAAGGVINIITDKSGNDRASITATIGSYGYKGLDGFIAGNLSDAYFNTFVHVADGNGWRENTASNTWSVSGRGGLNFGQGEAFIDYAIYRVANGLPGSIGTAAFNRNPKSARNLFDSQTKDGYRIRPGLSVKLTENVEFATEFSASQEDQHFDYVSTNFNSDRTADSYSFTPRLKWKHGLGYIDSASVLGYDYYYGKINADYHGNYANQAAQETSQAVYLQNSTKLTSNLDLSLGLRKQWVNQEASQTEYTPYFYPAISGRANKNKSAYDLGLSFHQTNWGAYTKFGNSFRFANTDELFGFDPLTFEPIFSGNIIKPQTAQNQEIGANFKQGVFDGKIAVYHSSVRNEIGFDALQSINTNFDPTRHQGIEAEFGWQVLDNLKTKISYALNDAEFKSGANKGNVLPLTPKNAAHAQLIWDNRAYGKYIAQINYVGKRYTSGDFSNSLNKLPSYTTIDLRANWDLKPVTLSLTALNILDKKYSPYAIFSTFKNDYFYFPADGRTLYFSARYDFK